MSSRQGLGRPPKTIVHLWSVTPNELPAADYAFHDTCQDLGFYSLLFLAQALGEQMVAEAAHVGVVSNR